VIRNRWTKGFFGYGDTRRNLVSRTSLLQVEEIAVFVTLSEKGPHPATNDTNRS
jgi:hypothetical protein